MDPAPLTEREHLQQIISEMSQGVILIEPDSDIAWANKAALRMHQVENVTDLGANAAEYVDRYCLKFRNGHELTAERYPINRVSRRETFSDVIVQVFGRGETTDEPLCIHSAGSLVVGDPQGSTAFYALVLTDVSDQVEAEERFEAAFRANPSPALICRISDLRFIKANAGFIEMTGWPREQVIGRSIYELDVFNKSADRERSIALLHENQTVPQTEAQLPLPGGTEKFVIVAGQPMEINNEDCMLLTFADLDPRRMAEADLRHSEERFSVSFKCSPVAQIIALSDGLKLLDANTRFAEVTGVSHVEAVGRDLADIRIWRDKATPAKLLQSLGRTDKLRNIDIQLLTPAGVVLDCLFSADAVTINGEACTLCSFEDITERKRSEIELISAIEAVMKDNWFGQSIVEKLATFRNASIGQPSPTLKGELTKRERQILEIACRGLGEVGIAEALGISRNTVRNHLASLYRKLGVNRRDQAVQWARQNGFLKPKSRAG